MTGRRKSGRSYGYGLVSRSHLGHKTLATRIVDALREYGEAGTDSPFHRPNGEYIGGASMNARNNWVVLKRLIDSGVVVERKSDAGGPVIYKLGGSKQ